MHVQKAGSTIEQYEDAYAYSVESAIAAISDGAGTAFESGRWARLLATTFVEWPPPGQNRNEVLDWVGRAAADWQASIPWQELSFFEEEKATSEGSAATLVGLRLEESASRAGDGRWQCMAMGDSCLFRITDGQLADAIPLTRSTDFSQRTSLFYTQRELSERDIGKLVTVQGPWCGGDTFLLLTDAIAEWFLREAERGFQPWETLASHDEQSFGSFVDEQRDQKLIRNDDVTVVTLDILTTRQHTRRSRTPVQARPDTTSREPPVLAGSGTWAGPASVPEQPQAARPISGRPPVRPWVQVIRARRRLVLAGALCLALLAGIVIGWAAGHAASDGNRTTSGPSRTPGSSSSPPQTASGIQSAARKFLVTLVTFRGDDLASYKSSLLALSTQDLAASLGQLLQLSSGASSSAESHGQVISITLSSATSSAAVLYAVMQQTVTTGHAGQSHQQFLLIRLEMARSGRNWQASQIQFIRSADRPPSGPAPTTPPGQPVPSQSTRVHTTGQLSESGPSNRGRTYDSIP